MQERENDDIGSEDTHIHDIDNIRRTKYCTIIKTIKREERDESCLTIEWNIICMWNILLLFCSNNNFIVGL